MLTSIGLSRLVAHHFSSRLAYYLFQQDDTAATTSSNTCTPSNGKFAKQEIHPGGKRNNFCIVID
jgi:hypothetical protein